ncbi:MAG: uL30 family ribosomal protein [Candidatus Anstonellales archaeon]
MILAVIKVRGHVGANPDVKKALQLLGLLRTNHCVLLEKNESNDKLLKSCIRYLTWGEISKESLKKLVLKKGEKGSKRIKEIYSEKELEEILEQIYSGKKKYSEFMDRIFRLHPPSKGYGNVKHIYPKGALGERDRKEMEDLIDQMC